MSFATRIFFFSLSIGQGGIMFAANKRNVLQCATGVPVVKKAKIFQPAKRGRRASDQDETCWLNISFLKGYPALLARERFPGYVSLWEEASRARGGHARASWQFCGKPLHFSTNH
jgi:hypothetical protein